MPFIQELTIKQKLINYFSFFVFLFPSHFSVYFWRLKDWEIFFFGCSTKQHFNVNQKKICFIYLFIFMSVVVGGWEKRGFFLIDYFIWRYFCEYKKIGWKIFEYLKLIGGHRGGLNWTLIQQGTSRPVHYLLHLLLQINSAKKITHQI